MSGFIGGLLNNFLWLTIGGALLAALMLAVRRAFASKLPNTWAYYLWLIVLLRFLIPAPSPLSIGGADLIPEASGFLREIIQYEPRWSPDATESGTLAAYEIQPGGDEALLSGETGEAQAGQGTVQQEQQMQGWQAALGGFGATALIIYALVAVWLAGVAVTSAKTAASYAKFRRSLRKTYREVSVPEITALYRGTGDELSLKKLPALYSSDAIHAPIQTGVFPAAIVLPEHLLSAPLGELRYFLLHELVHFKKRDVVYKWAIQACVCLHWFNPLAYLMKRELNTLCELSCDARVLGALEAPERAEYGNMLIRTIEAAAFARRSPLQGVAWENEKKIMKDRFRHILGYKKQSKKRLLAMAALSLFLAVIAAVAGPAVGVGSLAGATGGVGAMSEAEAAGVIEATGAMNATGATGATGATVAMGEAGAAGQNTESGAASDAAVSSEPNSYGATNPGATNTDATGQPATAPDPLPTASRLTQTSQFGVDGKIAIITNMRRQSEEEYAAAEALVEKYGAENVIHRTWPERFFEASEIMASILLDIATDPGVKALILSQAVDGANAAVARFREVRDDVFIVYCAPNEAPAVSARHADLVLTTNELAIGEAAVLQAKAMGAKTFVHYSFARHMAVTTLSNRRDLMKEVAEREGLRFVELEAIDNFSEAGAFGAQEFILNDVPKRVAEFGNDTAFFSTSCALQAALISKVVETGAIFPQPCCPTPNHGFPEALGYSDRASYSPSDPLAEGAANSTQIR